VAPGPPRSGGRALSLPARALAGPSGKIFGFFMAQALLVVLFALPFVAVAANRSWH
jgi:hypothetical protein